MAVEEYNLNAQAYFIYAHKQIISKIQLRLPHPLILLLNIHRCSLTRANAQLLHRVHVYRFCKCV